MRHSAISDAGDIWFCIKPTGRSSKKKNFTIREIRNVVRIFPQELRTRFSREVKIEILWFSPDYIAHKLVEKEITFAQSYQLVTVAFPRGLDRASSCTLAVRRARKFSTVSIFWAGSAFREGKEGTAVSFEAGRKSQETARLHPRDRSGLRSDPACVFSLASRPL